MKPKSNGLDHSANLSSYPMSDTKLHYKILRDTQLKRTTDKQGIKRIHDFLLVVVFYEKNRLLDKDICLKGGG